MAFPTKLGDFKVMTLKFKESSTCFTYIYVKRHSVRDTCPEKPANKTLFIMGVPPIVTKEMFIEMFSHFGKVKSVFFHSKPEPSTVPPENKLKFFKFYPEVQGYRVSYVVFEKSSSVEKVLALGKEDKLILMAEESDIPFGLPRWMKEYNDSILDPDEIMPEIEEYMAKYDKDVEEKERQLKLAMEPDEEGWVTVTKKSRKPGFARKESVHKRIMKKEKVKAKKKQLLNFYRFQIRESKMNQLVKLREKFEADKKKIEELKVKRKFKPF